MSPASSASCSSGTSTDGGSHLVPTTKHTSVVRRQRAHVPRMACRRSLAGVVCTPTTSCTDASSVAPRRMASAQRSGGMVGRSASELEKDEELRWL